MSRIYRHLRQSARKRAGFTLVEILIVVVILGILAAISLSAFTNMSSKARATILAENIRTMRIQIHIFYDQHLCIPPGRPWGDPTGAATEARFVEHMTLVSRADSATAAPGTAGYPYGPYFMQIPANPISGHNTVQIIPDGAAMPAAGDDSHGYVYQASTRIFRADSSGSDEDGNLFYDY